MTLRDFSVKYRLAHYISHVFDSLLRVRIPETDDSWFMDQSRAGVECEDTYIDLARGINLILELSAARQATISQR